MRKWFWHWPGLMGWICLPVFWGGVARAEPPAGYKLAWSDEFNGGSLDTNKWQCWRLGKWHDAVNTTNAIQVTNGCLVITAYTEAGTNYAGMVSTRERFEPVRGYWEARIEFNDSPGMWSAFWLQSPTIGQPLGNPAKAGVEIDIVEHRATADNGARIDGNAQHTLHWDGNGKFKQSKSHTTSQSALKSGFHVYGVEWTESAYRFYVDGKVTWTADGPISDAPEYLILSSAIQDKKWAGRIPPGGYGERAASRTKMLVDYVRYYHKAAP